MTRKGEKQKKAKLYQARIQNRQSFFLVQVEHLTTRPLSFLLHWWHVKCPFSQYCWL